MKSDSLSAQKKQLIVILLTYLVFAWIFGYAYRFGINPDGISLLRLAGYIAEGSFQKSITSSYSPLMTWLMSPFLFIGVDGLIAARIVIALSGAGLLLSSWLLTLRFGLSQRSRSIALLIGALLTSFWSIQNIGEDLLIAAFLTFYLYVVTNPNIIGDKKIAFFCGIVGGFSYLAHHYAFPFFLAHFPSMLLLRGYIDRDKGMFRPKKILSSLGIGITGFLIISSIWIGIVSAKYGHFTISSKGPIAHAAVGPKGKGHPFFAGGLYKPRDAYAIHVYEDPSEVKFKTWSPFESKEYLLFQLGLIKDNLVYILNHFVNQSPYFTYAFVIGIMILIPIALLLNPLTDEKRYLYYWITLTISVYCSGFILTMAKSPRRFYLLMLVVLFLSFHFLEEINNGLREIMTGPRKKLLAFYLLMVVVSAFALKPGIHLLKSVRDIITIDQVNPYREMADQISAIQFPSPYAIVRSAQKPYTDYYIAYYLRKQLLGRPLSTDVDGITEELRAADAKSLVVFDNLPLVERLARDNRYVFVSDKKLKKDSRYLHAVNIGKDEIKGWDEEVNVFTIK